MPPAKDHEPPAEPRLPAPDPGAGLGSAGAAMRAEWRAEQESLTRDAAEQWRHSRTLLDVAREHLHRGDRVAVRVAGHRAVGAIVEVARDRIAIHTDDGARVDVQVADSVPLAFSVVERARSGGRSSTRAATFRARLLELETAGLPVVVATTLGPDRVTGTLAVGADHVVITTPVGVEIVIARAAIASVSPAN